jgi:hypothetical protein
MKLPCWIRHSWGKWGEPYQEIYTHSTTYHATGRTIVDGYSQRFFQDRKCEECGITDTTCVKEVSLTEAAWKHLTGRSEL